MREINKFRAWDIHNQKFTYWTMSDLCTWDTKDEKPSALDDWQQYTGLKDKNGMEIYEGDILNIFDKGNVYVESHDDSYGVKSSKNFWINNLINIVSISPYCEVVGNIYQNPSLLTNN